MNDKFYLTTMRELMKNGSTGDHIYIVGLFETERMAILAGKLEQCKRSMRTYSHRYVPEVCTMRLNEMTSDITLKAVEKYIESID